MLSNPFKRLAADVVQADSDAFRALKGIPGYKSTNPAYSYESLEALDTRLREKQDSDLLIQNAAAASRDGLAQLENERHEAVLGMKDQIRAQFGVDSDEVAAVGLKKKSERKPRARSKKPEEMAKS